MGPRSLGLRIALVAVPMAAVIATYDDGVAARSVIENLSKQGSLAVKHFLPANDVQDHARAGAEHVVPMALEAFLAKNPNALISGIDWQDRTPIVEISAIDNNQVVTYQVNTDGKISQYKRENDAEEIAEIRAATVSISEAIARGSAQQPTGMIDSVSIKNDDGLHWELSFDDTDFSDLATIRIAAR